MAQGTEKKTVERGCGKIGSGETTTGHKRLFEVPTRANAMNGRKAAKRQTSEPKRG